MLAEVNVLHSENVLRLAVGDMVNAVYYNSKRAMLEDFEEG